MSENFMVAVYYSAFAVGSVAATSRLGTLEEKRAMWWWVKPCSSWIEGTSEILLPPAVVYGIT